MTEFPGLPSPCVSICEIDTINGYCRGCYRTREEIANWTKLSFGEQNNVIGLLHTRRAAAGGRQRRQRRERVARAR